MKKFFWYLVLSICIILWIISITLAFTQEQQDAYQWAYKYELTSQPTIETAKMNSPLTRQAFAKMIVKYLENVIWIKKTTTNTCHFTDESKITDDLKPYTKKICEYQIMWTNWKKFSPTQPIDRAQLWTALSRILRWDKHNVEWKWYYIYHVNALQTAGIMNNIKEVKWVTAKRWDVMIMFKRMYEKFGTKIYLNSWTQNIIKEISNIKETTESWSDTELSNNYEDTENEYITAVYNNSNIIFTWKDWNKYYYDDKFLNLLKETAEKKWESELADYLKIEAEYFKNGLDQLSNLDDEELIKSMWIDTEKLNPEMTKQEKKELINKLKTGLGKIIDENKNRNDKLENDLSKIIKNIKNDKFLLKEKYEKTKAFMEISNTFLDLYSENLFSLIEITLSQDEDDEDSEEWMAQAFWIIWAALMYQWAAQEYQTYVEERAINTIKLLWWELSTNNINNNLKSEDVTFNQKLLSAEKRARDVSRKTDLSQIQVAIITSQHDKWMWPWMDKWATKWIPVSTISKELISAWMSYVPSDSTEDKKVIWLWSANTVDWWYSYLVAKRNWTNNAWFVLMAKQETAWNSNWVVCDNKSWLENWYITNDTDLANIKLCNKVEEWNSCSTSKCTYTNDDELRYIVIY